MPADTTTTSPTAATPQPIATLAPVVKRLLSCFLSQGGTSRDARRQRARAPPETPSFGEPQRGPASLLTGSAGALRATHDDSALATPIDTTDRRRYHAAMEPTWHDGLSR